jgi:large subunit ribosomal protein L28
VITWLSFGHPAPGRGRRVVVAAARLRDWSAARTGASPRPVKVNSPMSKICQVTGRKPSFGKTISHSHRRGNRRWTPNIQKQRFWVESEKRWVTLTVSAKGIKTINKKGIDAVLADMRRRGEKV